MQDKIELFEASQDMLICELDKLVQKQELTPQTLSYLDTLVDIIKDLDEIMDNEDARNMEGYSQRSGRRMYNRSSYRNGNSYGNYENYNNYARRGTSMRMDGGNGQGQYSRNSGKEEMLNHLYMALDSASSEEERKRVQRMIDEIEHA